MIAPPLGICLPVQWIRAIDADTIEVKLRTGQHAKIRLKDVDAPELNTSEGKIARDYVNSIWLSHEEQDVRLWLPLPEDTDKSGVIDIHEIIRDVLSFERCVGRIFVSGIDVADKLVRMGLAKEWK